MKTFRKQPRDHLDYDIDLSGWLNTGDVITAIEVAAPGGIDVTSTSFTDTEAKLWIDNGTSGQSYKFSVLFTTTSRQKEVDFLMVVQEL